MPTLNELLDNETAQKVICAVVQSKAVVDGHVAHHYIANVDGYITHPTDTPANTPFEGIIAASPKFERGMSIPIGLTVDKSFQSVGSIEVSNPAGALDYLALGHSFDSMPVKIYFGGIRSAFADFVLIQQGKSGSGLMVDSDRLRLDVRDESLELDVPLVEDTITGGTESDGELYPIVLGCVFNAQPKLLDAATHTYQYSLPPTKGGMPAFVTAVRDNGHDVAGYATDSNACTFSLTEQPYGDITCDAHTSITYPAALALWIIKNCTNYNQALIDEGSFAAVDSARPVDVGFFAADTVNVREVLIKLLASSVSSLNFKRNGMVFVKHFGDNITNPNLAADYTIPHDYIVDNTFNIEMYSRPVQALAVKYRPNWTTQAKLAEPVTNNKLDEALAKDYAENYSEISDSAMIMPDGATLVSEIYPSARRLTGDNAIETLIYSALDANAVMTGLKIFFNRVRWKVTITVQNGYGFGANVGDAISLEYSRYGVDSRVMVITRLSDDIANNTTTIEALF